MEDNRKIDALEMIVANMKREAKCFDGRPFNGKVIAEYFGNLEAAIVEMANIMDSILKQS